MTGDREHRELRELLGAHLIGDLSLQETVALQAHLDGCPSCRAELDELGPVVRDLRLVDVDRLPGPPAPPRELGERVLAAVRAESTFRDRSRAREERRRRLRAVAVPLGSAAVAAVLAGTIAYRVALPEPEPAPSVAIEELQPNALVSSVRATGPAVVVPHTWGVEVSFEGAGFTTGATYRTQFRTDDGRVLPAGEFLGVGAGELTCDMQAAVLREDVVTFEVLDEAGTAVMELDLPSQA